MCGGDGEDDGRADAPWPHAWTRRQVLQAGAVAALGGVVLSRRGVTAADAATLSGAAPVVAGMHVHATYSEGAASWEQQYAAALAAGADVLFQSDHDWRARAEGYVAQLSGAFVASTTGSWARHAASFSALGPIRVMVVAKGAGAATQTLAMQDRNAFGHLRTGIQGQTLTVAFGTSRLDPGARFEVVLTLSVHPAQAGRPGGQYALRYRFQPGAMPQRFTEAKGLAGVVLAPMPAGGTTLTLDPVPDIAAIWPDMLAVDNGTYGLAFVVTSPRTGVVADVALQRVAVNRALDDAAGVLAAQQQFADTYSARYGVTGYVAEEVSYPSSLVPHWNRFGSAPEFGVKTGVTTSTWQTWYGDYMARAHATGALVSWNHPMGFSGGPLLSAVDQTAHRQQVFAELQANDLMGADLLEVGYNVRGHMPMSQHVALWDTFSRRARWLTGNGVSDDHSGKPWQSLGNGHLTGIWAASPGLPDLTAALAAGRAFVFHPGRTPGLRLDTLVDDAVPMGAVSVSDAVSRTLAIRLDALPSDGTVELVGGPVDLTGEDPGTTVLDQWTATAFPGGSSTVTVPVDTSSSCFVRVQVRRSGALTATGNPTWLLRTAPPAGIPPARAV